MLLTKTEYCFYIELKKQCDAKGFLICPKVRMEDFLNVTDKEKIPKYRGYIKSRHIDFLICNARLHLLCGIELDDSTHNYCKVKIIDDFKDNVFKAIGIPLHRVKVIQSQYKTAIEEILLGYQKDQKEDLI